MKLPTMAWISALAVGIDVMQQGYPSVAAPKATTTSGNANLIEPIAGWAWAPSQEGYGHARPSTIYNGGDPTGMLEHIHWVKWGQEKAVGTGVGFHVPSGGIVADGRKAPAQIIVWDIGTCHGKRAYRKIEWYFPQYGQSFDPHNYINMCTGDYVDDRHPANKMQSAPPKKSTSEKASQESGNFSGYELMLEKTGLFTRQGTLNGFNIYQSKQTKQNCVVMRNCDGYCCEGMITVQPMKDEDLEAYVMFIYAPLQNTLALTNKESVANHFKNRVSILREEIMTNLQQSNRTEFAFDHLNVRGECQPVSDADLKTGKTPELVIKLWIP